MWQQKQNNFMNLDELAGLSDEITTTKTALWQRLEVRLQEKPQKAKVLLYWVAACLLICVSVFVLFISNHNNNSEGIAVNKSKLITQPILKKHYGN
jgi:hypothetical protein